MGIVKEFREFAIRGNMIDMAVGIIIGAAFGSVVSSLVGDVLTPLLGLFSGGIDMSDKVIVLREAATDNGEPLVLKWGGFLQSCIDFLIKAFAIFMIVKAINTAKKQFEREKEQVAAASPPTPEVQLLTEIRDSLRRA
jgi:large conductance mechanosensitive channel